MNISIQKAANLAIAGILVSAVLYCLGLAWNAHEWIDPPDFPAEKWVQDHYLVVLRRVALYGSLLTFFTLIKTPIKSNE